MNEEQRGELEQFLGEQIWQNFDLLVVGGYSPDLANMIRSRTDAPLFFFEPDAERRALASADDAARSIFVVPAIEELRARMRPHVRPATRFLQFSPDWDTDRFTPQQLAAFSNAVQKTYSTSAQSNLTALVLARRWVDQMMLALPSMVGLRSINAMHGALRGLPGIVVSAGPSLDVNIAHLAAATQRAVVVSVNTALLPLEAAGCTPHWCCAAEAKDCTSQLRQSTNLERVRFAPGTHANHALYDLPWKEINPAVSALGPFGAWLIRALGVTESIGCGGTVSTLATAMLQHLGCDPVILVGQDCAFKPDGQAYASGTTHSDARYSPGDGGKANLYLAAEQLKLNATLGFEHKKIDSDRVLVPAWGGKGEVETIQMFADFATWFEEAVYFARQRGEATHFINATEGGASIGNWDEARLADVLETLPVQDIAGRIEAAMEATTPTDVDTIVRGLREQLGHTNRAGRLAARAHKLAVDLAATEAEFRELTMTAAIVDAWVAPEIARIRHEDSPRYKDPMSRTIDIFAMADEAANGELPRRIKTLIKEVERVRGVQVDPGAVSAA